LNLLLNSVEAMGGPGAIRVRYCEPSPELGAKQFQIVVHDSGPGIRGDVLDRIFNPFFTTKDTGTGLGLSIVHRIVEAHDGTITATNDPAGGAKFEIRI
jgi:signal transduction histidine kinase